MERPVGCSARRASASSGSPGTVPAVSIRAARSGLRMSVQGRGLPASSTGSLPVSRHQFWGRLTAAIRLWQSRPRRLVPQGRLRGRLSGRCPLKLPLPPNCPLTWTCDYSQRRIGIQVPCQLHGVVKHPTDHDHGRFRTVDTKVARPEDVRSTPHLKTLASTSLTPVTLCT